MVAGVTQQIGAPDAGQLVFARSAYINREISWLQFNGRVLEEALDTRHPLLERLKFLAIFSSNLDEFFMIRASALQQQLAAGNHDVSPEGLTPAERLAAIRTILLGQLEAHAACWRDDILPSLRQEGFDIGRMDDLPPHVRPRLRAYFEREIYPVLTPLAFDPAHPFPHISSLSLNLAVVVHDPVHGERFARVKVPDHLPRLFPVSPADDASLPEGHAGPCAHIWLEDLIAANLDLLFPGLEVRAAYPFRVTRNADLEVEVDEASDLLASIEESLDMREFGFGVRLETDHTMPAHTLAILTSHLAIEPHHVYAVEGPVGMSALMEITRFDRPKLKFPPLVQSMPPALATDESIFAVLRRRDVLLYHPYDSFMPVIDFLREAAQDPRVLAIKQTLYRVGPNSPVVKALLEARDNGKQVAVVVELRARFDEENNIAWARAMEQRGVHVAYGLVGLKTHAKMCLVVRREDEGIARYVHLGTGNYNPVTSRIYTDLGLFTSDEAIGEDVSDLFNALTGYSRRHSYRKLLVAPIGLREQLISRIEREVTRQQMHGDGYIMLKANSLVDAPLIDALYAASRAGVTIHLQVRGICCLRPGVPGMSETITVTSIVGRFLEHARIFHFRNGGNDEVLLGSADLMPRNLDNRVEVLFPITNRRLKRAIIEGILASHIADNQQARQLGPDGLYTCASHGIDEEHVNSQFRMMAHPWYHNL